MSTTDVPSTAPLPDYIASNVPNPLSNRAPWFKNTAPTYAGIFLWFVFWQDAVKTETAGGGLAAGLGVALIGIVLAALICHLMFYLVPGLLGMRTGRPLYIVGTSTFGATGGFLMPGFLMGLLQFGWLGVNTYFSSLLLANIIPGVPKEVIMVIWGIGAAFVGLAGIQYVAKVATYLPLIPLVILLVLAMKTIGGVGTFDPQKLIETHRTAGVTLAPLNALGVVLAIVTYVVGFFATAGAAGVDFGTNSRDDKDVQTAGWVGIAMATLFTAGISALIVAGVHGSSEFKPKADAAAAAAATQALQEAETAAKANNRTLTEKDIAKVRREAVSGATLNSVKLIPVVLGDSAAKWLSLLLAIAAFPPACFSSFIAANSFKTTLPKVNPYISVGIGAIISITLALTGYAGDAAGVFTVIGASFGPIVGAMVVDYLIAGKRWTGPRAGFNPAGWIAWLLGFAVGITPNLHGIYASIPAIPAAPVAAFIVGAVVYYVCMAAGLKTPVIAMPTGTELTASN